jgi:hypothetical protein
VILLRIGRRFGSFIMGLKPIGEGVGAYKWKNHA